MPNLRSASAQTKRKTRNQLYAKINRLNKKIRRLQMILDKSKGTFTGEIMGLLEGLASK